MPVNICKKSSKAIWTWAVHGCIKLSSASSRTKKLTRFSFIAFKLSPLFLRMFIRFLLSFLFASNTLLHPFHSYVFRQDGQLFLLFLTWSFLLVVLLFDVDPHGDTWGFSREFVLRIPIEKCEEHLRCILFCYNYNTFKPNIIVTYDDCNGQVVIHFSMVRLGYCFTPYQRLWPYNGAPLVAFYGIRRTYSRLKSPASSRGHCKISIPILDQILYLHKYAVS